MELPKAIHYTNLEVLVSHANAALTRRHRLRIARLIVDDHWPVVQAARRFNVTGPTVKRWVDRYQGQIRRDVMIDFLREQREVSDRVENTGELDVV